MTPEPEPTLRSKFIKELAQFLAGGAPEKSMMLEITRGDPTNKAHTIMTEWANLRAASGLFGYPTVEEAEAHLRRFLDADN
jgi:hypothetical protein